MPAASCRAIKRMIRCNRGERERERGGGGGGKKKKRIIKRRGKRKITNKKKMRVESR